MCRTWSSRSKSSDLDDAHDGKLGSLGEDKQGIQSEEGEGEVGEEVGESNKASTLQASSYERNKKR